jgi:flavin-binding protein dodecin
VPNSPTSASAADDDGFRRACAEAIEELRAARRLIAAQGVESKLLVEMIDLEREISTGLKNLRNLDAAEVVQLRKAIDAKDRVIAALEAEIVVLKKNRWGFWKKAKAIAVGVGAGIVIGAIVTNR